MVDEFEADVERDGASRASILAEIKSVVSQMRMLSAGKSDAKVNRHNITSKFWVLNRLPCILFNGPENPTESFQKDSKWVIYLDLLVNNQKNRAVQGLFSMYTQSITVYYFINEYLNFKGIS